ncbi:MAG: hypothetical protein V2J08_01845 [Desulfotignum sp.]|nr:hypothetical protein [Desulfotignum sp.]
MPFLKNLFIFLVFTCPAAGFFQGQAAASAAQEGLETYYVRYDIKYADNRITDENLLMVPAENEFRMEKFSRATIAGVISMTSGESKNHLFSRARDQALKQLLKTRGLTSVTSENRVTIVSHEGVVRTPVQIIPKKGAAQEQEALQEQEAVQEQRGLPEQQAVPEQELVPEEKTGLVRREGVPMFFYTAETFFAPLAFPDQWEKLKARAYIKEKIDAFFQLLK